MLGLLYLSILIGEIQRGIVTEPVVGWQMNDIVDHSKLLSGIRLSFLNSDISDAVITGEVSALAATKLTGGQKTPDTDYLFDGGILFYEFYHPMASRLALGGSAERRAHTIRPGLYYRASLGGYVGSRFGIFADLAGRVLFRQSQYSFPIDIGISAQIVF